MERPVRDEQKHAVKGLLGSQRLQDDVSDFYSASMNSDIQGDICLSASGSENDIAIHAQASGHTESHSQFVSETHFCTEIHACNIVPELVDNDDGMFCLLGDDQPELNVSSHHLGMAGFETEQNVVLPDIVDKCITMCDMNVRLAGLGNKPVISSQMNIDTWQYYLQFENNEEIRAYLDYGIINGFHIVDEGADIQSYKCVNYDSVYSGSAFHYINDLILSELAQGKYIRADFTPHCVHALGAVPKHDGNFRPITDCRRPLGNSINNYMDSTFQHFSYCTIDEVTMNVTPGCYMATVDIASAYRSVPVHPSDWTYQGISWPLDDKETYLLDTHICFGLRCAPYIFTVISNFIASTMKKLGYQYINNYLDDFIVFGETYEQCQQAQSTLITLLGQLGFNVSWKKCTTPSTSVSYLGILFDSIEYSLSLPKEKLCKLRRELDFFKDKTRATKRQIQRLCGILSHCSKVVRGGRTFSRRVIDLLKGLQDGNPRIRLSSEFRKDVEWWYDFAAEFNGKEFLINPNFGAGPVLQTDSCIQGYGLICDNDWQAGLFNSIDKPLGLGSLDQSHNHWENVLVPQQASINYLELVPIDCALNRFQLSWKNQHVLIYTDNTQVVAPVNRGISQSENSMDLLRGIFWNCAKNNIYLTARHVPGIENYWPDLLSRMYDMSNIYSFYNSSLCCSKPGHD